MSPRDLLPTLATQPSAPPLQAQPARDPQTGNADRREAKITPDYLNILGVFGALAVVYVSWASALGLENHNPAVAHTSIWVTAAFIFSLIIIFAHLYHLAAKLLDRSETPELYPPSIRVHAVDSGEQAAQVAETRTASLAPVEAVPGTLPSPNLLHPPRFQRSFATQPLRPTAAEYSAAGRNPHVGHPVERIPSQQRAWSQDATGHGPLVNRSQSTAWNAPSDGALLGWTLFLPLDPRMYGRVRKQPGTTRPIFSSPNCDVWKCEIEFTEPSSSHPNEAALKVVRRFVAGENDPVTVLERINARLNQEAITWAGVHHPNTVPLLGVIFSPVHALVLPWYRNGNLRTYLASYPAANKLKLINDIAQALGHLHSRTPKIIQADLKPENVLISDQGDALITDFGMSTVLGEDHWYTPSHLFGGTMQWTAPEILLGEGEKRSRTGDVYSFGSLTCFLGNGDLYPNNGKFAIVEGKGAYLSNPAINEGWKRDASIAPHTDIELRFRTTKLELFLFFNMLPTEIANEANPDGGWVVRTLGSERARFSRFGFRPGPSPPPPGTDKTTHPTFKTTSNELRTMSDNDAAPEPKPELEGNAPISVKVVASTGEEVFFKIKRSTKLTKLQGAYANKVGKDINSIRFLYDGQRIQEDDTPATLGMEEGDAIDVMVEQVGGYRSS
ncbi:hypothetical protein FRC01_014235 [Tulasnella sp. 417]|nr:hypothetical protein FRC01_014235 [Tulasnella sp. 417]